MARRIVMMLALVVGLSAFVSPLWASDATFPIGIWLYDYGAPYLLSRPTWLAALRWQGINLGAAGGSVAACRQRLATYDSVGGRIWLMPDTFHYSDSFPVTQHLDITGRDASFTDSTKEYFTSTAIYDPTPDIHKYRTRTQFNAFLDGLMDSVVEPVKNYHALWKYFLWDEANNFHYFHASLPWTQYWQNIWGGPDTFCTRTDSLGVFSCAKWKIEHHDSLHSVLMDIGKYPYSAAYSLCTMKYHAPDTSNMMQGISFNNQPFRMSTLIGDSSMLAHFTSAADTVVDAAQKASPADPIPVYVAGLQDYGRNIDTSDYRIPIPEEIRAEANLAILHQVKGQFYFLLPSHYFNNFCDLWDQNLVPFDTLYKEYVYVRDTFSVKPPHNYYYSPDSLAPFWDNTHTVHDPFRTLGTKPNPSSSAKGWESYYKWKYAPYARNWDSLKSINSELHVIAPHLRYIWKVGQRITRVVPDFHGPPGPPLPEYVTFADSTQGHNPTAFYAFLVSKDFGNTQWGDSVIVNLPSPPPGQSYYVLDLNSRHLIPSTGHVSFHTVLKSGEGRLFKFLVSGTPPGEPMAAQGSNPNPYNGSMWSTLLVTDPDMFFHKSGQTAPNVQFTEGDTVVLSATVYNLGFAGKTDSVKFYLGDPLAGGTFLGGSSVTVPALSTSDTLQKTVTVTYNLVTNYITPLGPYDVNVILKGATSSAHSLLWLNAQDYATKVNGSPWNMDETKPNPDIASYVKFNNLTDSISSCWEGTENLQGPGYPELHFRLASSIDTTIYKKMTFRVFSDQDDSCKVRCSPGGETVWYALPKKQWQVITTRPVWSGSRYVTDFYLRFYGLNSSKIRLAWANLTTR